MAREPTSPYLEGTYQNAFMEKQAEFLAKLGFNYPRSPCIINQLHFPDTRTKGWEERNGIPLKTLVTGFRPQFQTAYKETVEGIEAELKLVETYEVFQNPPGQGYDAIAGAVSLWDLGILIEPKKEPGKSKNPPVLIAGKDALELYHHFRDHPKEREGREVQLPEDFKGNFTIPYFKRNNDFVSKNSPPPHYKPRVEFVATINPTLTFPFVNSMVQAGAYIHTFTLRPRHVGGLIATTDLENLVDLRNNLPQLARTFPGLISLEIDTEIPKINQLTLRGVEHELEEARASLLPKFSRREERRYIEEAGGEEPKHLV